MGLCVDSGRAAVRGFSRGLNEFGSLKWVLIQIFRNFKQARTVGLVHFLFGKVVIFEENLLKHVVYFKKLTKTLKCLT